MNRHRSFRRSAAAALALLALGAGTAAAQSPPTVTVAVLDHFEAFDPDTDRPANALALTAIVLRRTPWGDGDALIILSPSSLAPQTLAAALRALGPAGGSGANLVVVTAGAAQSQVPAAVGAALEARLGELAAREPSYVPRLGRGRAITIANPLKLLDPNG